MFLTTNITTRNTIPALLHANFSDWLPNDKDITALYSYPYTGNSMYQKQYRAIKEYVKQNFDVKLAVDYPKWIDLSGEDQYFVFIDPMIRFQRNTIKYNRKLWSFWDLLISKHQNNDFIKNNCFFIDIPARKHKFSDFKEFKKKHLTNSLNSSLLSASNGGQKVPWYSIISNIKQTEFNLFCWFLDCHNWNITDGISRLINTISQKQFMKLKRNSNFKGNAEAAKIGQFVKNESEVLNYMRQSEFDMIWNEYIRRYNKNQ